MKKGELYEKEQELEVLRDTQSAEDLQQNSEDGIDTPIIISKQNDEEGVEGDDPIVRWKDQVLQFNLFDLGKNFPEQSLSFSSLLRQCAAAFPNFDRKRTPMAKIGDIEVGMFTTFSSTIDFTSTTGKEIKKGDKISISKATSASDVLTALGYTYDLSNLDWSTDSSQQIEIIYAENINPEKIISLDSLAPGFNQIKNKHGVILKDKIDLDSLSFEDKVEISSLYTELIDPIKNSYKLLHEEDIDPSYVYGTGVVKSGILKNLQNFVERSAISTVKLTEEYQKASENKKSEYISKFIPVIQEMFDIVISEIYKNTYQYQGRDRIVEIIDQALERTILEIIIKKMKPSEGRTKILGSELPSKIKEYMEDLDASSEKALSQEINAKIAPLFMQQFLESFFHNQPRHKESDQVMTFSSNLNNFIGPKREAEVYAFIAPHFLFKQFVLAGADPSKFLFYKFTQFNPLSPSQSFIPNILGGVEHMLNVIKKINNEATMHFSGHSNRRVGDIIYSYIKGLSHLNFEIKNSRSSSLSGHYNNIGRDTFRSIFPVSFKAINDNSFFAEDQIEVLTVPSPLGQLEGGQKIYSKIAAIKKHADLDPVDNYYGRYHTSVADLINKEGFNCYDDIVDLFKNVIFLAKVNDLIYEIFREKSSNSLINDAREIFTRRENYDQFVREDTNGNLKLFMDFTSRAYINTGEKLKFGNLRGLITFEVINGEKESFNYKDDDEEFDTMVMLVHDDKDRLGIVRADRLKDNRFILPPDVYDGYSDNVNHKGVCLTDADGNLLFSNFVLTSDNQIIIISDEQLAEFIRTGFGSYQLNSYESFVGKYFRSSVYEAGNLITPVVQKVESYLIPTGLEESLLDGPTIKYPKTKAINKKISLPIIRDIFTQANPDNDIIYESDLYDSCFSFSSLIYQIKNCKAFGSYHISDSVLQFHKKSRILEDGSKVHYSFDYIKSVIGTLGFSEAQLKEITAYYIDDSGDVQLNTLSVSKRQKTFYKTFLGAIQALPVDGENKFISGWFRQHSHLYDTSKYYFSPNDDYISNQDFNVIKELSIALQDIFSQNGLGMLKLGLYSISINSHGNYDLDFVSHTKETLGTIIFANGIRPFTSNKKPKMRFGPKYLRNVGHSGDRSIPFYTSVLMHTYYELIEVEGVITELFYTPPTNNLDILFENLELGNNKNKNQYLIHESMRTQFLNLFFSSYSRYADSEVSYYKSYYKKELFSILSDTLLENQLRKTEAFKETEEMKQEFFMALSKHSLFHRLCEDQGVYSLAFRNELLLYLLSKGNYEPTLEFKSASLALNEETKNLKEYYTLKLRKSDFHLFESMALDFIASLTPIKSIESNPSNIYQQLSIYQEAILDTAKFLLDMAVAAGEKIILYPFSRLSNGFGYDFKSEHVSDYLPERISLIDKQNPFDDIWSGRKAERFYVIDPADAESLYDQLPQIIASIYIDDQLLVARTMLMPKDEALYILNYFTPIGNSASDRFTPDMVLGPTGYIRPSYSGLSANSESIYQGLHSEWLSLIEKHSFVQFLISSDLNPLTFYGLFNNFFKR